MTVTGEAGVLAAGGAAHLVQGIVRVDVRVIVEMLGFSKTVVVPAAVIVWPIVHEENVVYTTSVVVLGSAGAGGELTGDLGVEAGVEAGGVPAAVNGIELGQLVIRPGF